MKIKHLILSATILFLGACHSSSEQQASTIDSADMPVMRFAQENHNFGEVNQGDSVRYSYTFTNTGKTPLTITEAMPSCGCTTPEFTKEPIKPGDKGVIKVIFNSANFQGKVMKTIAVTSNAKQHLINLHLEGNVIPKK